MALLLAPRTLARYDGFKKLVIRNMTEVKQSDGKGGICSVPERPVCPPCVSASRPACRLFEPAQGPLGLHRVCCAPSAGQRPPCSMTPPPCPKTCRHANEQKNIDQCVVTKSRSLQQEKCGDNLDRVARRIAAAKLTRRLDYEREVTEKKPIPVPDPIAYSLVDEHECMRATDGHDYTACKKPITQSQCGPCRIPPPPCPVRLQPLNDCKISHSQHLEPCAHRPRTFLEIDRSQTSSTKDKSTISPLKDEKNKNQVDTTSSTRLSTSGSLTRIIETLKNTRGTSLKQSCKQSSTSGKARHAGDKSWCANIPKPTPVPDSCKEPSLTERLRRRSKNLCSKPCESRHRLHTKTCGGKKSETKENTQHLQTKSHVSKLKSILTERSQLKEAGLGRVMTTRNQINDTNPLSEGLMELQIPPTSDSVRVRVSLNFENSKSTICDAPLNSPCKISPNLSSCTNNCSRSWLSIKNLQKKFTGCRKQDSDAQQILEKNKEHSKEPCKPKTFGDNTRREASKSSIPLTDTPSQSINRGQPRREPPKCSFKQDFLNSLI